VSFFDLPPPPPAAPEPARQPWRGDSSDTVGGTTDLVLLLARNDKAAVLVSGVVAYPRGFSVNVVTFSRLFEPMGRRSGGPHGAAADEALRFGIRFADGSKVTNVASTYAPVPRPSDGRLLQPRGGGGGGRKFTSGFWCEPLPPPGPMAFVCEWPQFDIPVIQEEVDAGIILAAAERAYPVWPDDVGLPGPPPPGGDRPSGFVAIHRSASATGQARAVPRKDGDPA